MAIIEAENLIIFLNTKEDNIDNWLERIKRINRPEYFYNAYVSAKSIEKATNQPDITNDDVFNYMVKGSK